MKQNGHPLSKPRGFRANAALHRWVALVMALFLALFAASGIILNHRAGVSRINISRALLPAAFRYQHWNNAAIKGATWLDDSDVLLYGAVGVWRADGSLANLRDYNHGLPAGADRRRIERIFQTTTGDILAGTRYGLYRLDTADDDTWVALAFPSKDRHVVDLAQKGDTLYVLTRSHILAAPVTSPESLQAIQLQPPPGWDGRVPLLRIIWQLHSGELFGVPGRLSVDLIGGAMIALAISGVLLFVLPRRIRRRKRAGGPVSSLAATTRLSRRWHRRIGITMALFLIACAATGMLLRPPFLLTIVRAQSKPWPGTTLHGAGPWHDRLRRLHYDASLDRFLLATGDGIFFYNSSLESTPQRARREPPVSVMGVNVLEQTGPGRYLIGSFSGLYLWLPDKDILMDWISRGPPPGRNPRLPSGAHMVAGYLRGEAGAEYVFDYRAGAMALGHDTSFPDMPPAAQNAPMSLWNLALETHTGRIYQKILGSSQLLWVAIAGIFALTILISGTHWWLHIRLRRRHREKA
ncbi:MAG: PepSY domain-containing protein [Kiritimatiellia bacterium]|jgi:hypothetical protein|nr:PepSY domain-containing protein [Kiritimatiellia bacterium]MDP6809865.1 PepSY domain-containing protein [Kiritimatiellia bacterium]MDP7024257.1 PepSY domain-containing protein [Kiritimatiellia bacterium]